MQRERKEDKRCRRNCKQTKSQAEKAKGERREKDAGGNAKEEDSDRKKETEKRHHREQAMRTGRTDLLWLSSEELRNFGISKFRAESERQSEREGERCRLLDPALPV